MFNKPARVLVPNISGLMIINLDLSPHTPLIFVFMLVQSLLSILKVDPPQYRWHSLTLARPLTKLVTEHFLKKRLTEMCQYI